MEKILTELKRRNVFRVGLVYAIVAWLLMQLSTQLEGSLNLPSWFDTFVTVIALIGFPIAVTFAWAFEMTPEGVKPTRKVSKDQSITSQTGRKLNYALMGLLALAVAFIGWQNLRPDETSLDAARSADASIAVLPFADLSPNGDQEYFADGISEELLNVFAKVKGLNVAGRTSSFAFKGKNQDIREIARLLDVAHVLEGSVRKSGNNVRVTAQLIRADNGFHMWSDTYDGDLTDIFKVQDEIANAILTELKPKLMGEVTSVSTPRTDVTAYDFYLIAQQKIPITTHESYKYAADALDKALAIDPDFVPALAWRGYLELMLSDGAGALGAIPLEDALKTSDVWIQKALTLDRNSADTLFARAGWLSFSLDRQDRDQAEAWYKRAIEVNPNSVAVRNDYGYWLIENRRPEEAIQQLEIGQRHDPGNGDINANLANYYLRRGFDEKARALLTRWAEISPDQAAPIGFMSGMASMKGELAEAYKLSQKAYEIAPNGPRYKANLMGSYFALGEYQTILDQSDEYGARRAAMFVLGRKDEAVAVDRKELEDRPDSPDHQAGHIFTLYMINELDELLAFYEDKWGSIEALDQAFSHPPFRYIAYAMLKQGHKDGPAMLDAERNHMKEHVEAGELEIFEAQRHAFIRMLEDNPDKAVGLLEASFDYGIRSVLPFVEPVFQPLRGTPRYEALKTKYQAAINAERVKLGWDPIEIAQPTP